MTARLAGAGLTMAFGAAACSLIVGVGDHHLRPADASVSEEGDEVAPVAEAGEAGDAADATDATEAADTGEPAESGDGGGEEGATGTQPVVLASGLQRPTALWTDGATLFWIAEASGALPGAVLSMPVSGGAPTTLVPAVSRPVALRAQSGTSFVFFTADGVGDAGGPGLYRVPKSGGPAMPFAAIADDRRFDALGVPNTFQAAFTEALDPDGGATALRRTDLTGIDAGACYPYVQPSPGAIPAISADDSNVYFVDTSVGSILRAGLGCSGSIETFAPGQPAAHIVTWDSTDVFWATDQATLRLAKASPGGTPLQLATFAANPVAMTFPSPSGSGTFVACADGTIWRVLYPDVTLVASGQDDPSGIAVITDGTVYWTDRGSGQIVMLPP